MNEYELQGAIVDAASDTGWDVHASGRSLFVNLILVRERVVWVIVGEPLMMQRRWLARLQRAGAEVHVWTLESWQDGHVERTLARPPVRAA